ncbi:MAG: hypothetical protein AB7E24_11915 [Novosphingobium sp.]
MSEVPQSDDDCGPWFVRVIHDKVAVGIFACTEYQLADLIDEVCEPDACEYKKLPPGGFIFGGEYVIHDPALAEDSPYMEETYFTESWAKIYDEAGLWRRLNTPFFDNDE